MRGRKIRFICRVMGDTESGASSEAGVGANLRNAQAMLRNAPPAGGCRLFRYAASIAAWNDETHVAENRRLYAEKFSKVVAILEPVLPVALPDAGFYLWIRTPIADAAFAQGLYRDYNVAVLPGSYLARTAQGVNPGENFVRLALVASTEETVEAAQRIAEFSRKI